MIEPEMAFADINDNMNIAQEMIKYIFGYILENAPEEMAFFEKFIEAGVMDKITEESLNRNSSGSPIPKR